MFWKRIKKQRPGISLSPIIFNPIPYAYQALQSGQNHSNLPSIPVKKSRVSRLQAKVDSPTVFEDFARIWSAPNTGRPRLLWKRLRKKEKDFIRNSLDQAFYHFA